jgi:hypothetical protein
VKIEGPPVAIAFSLGGAWRDESGVHSSLKSY